jgi:hypothetical protein
MNSPIRLTSLDEQQMASSGNLIGIAFPKSASKSYGETVAIAQKAASYGEIVLGQKLFHAAVFGLDKVQASYAVMVAEASKNWKGTKLFAQGRLLERNYNVVEVLKCYLNSLESADKKAHCHFLYRDLALYQVGKNVEKYRVPCRMLQGFTQEMIRDDLAAPQDRLHAAGVRRGSFWCPHFDAKSFRKISSDASEKDASPKISGTTLALTHS